MNGSFVALCTFCERSGPRILFATQYLTPGGERILSEFQYLTQYMPSDSDETISTSHVTTSCDTTLHSVCMSCMSTEHVGSGREGDMLFWDDAKQLGVGAYIFRIADSMARGGQRQFGMFFLEHNFNRLCARWPLVRSHFTPIAAALSSQAETVMKAECGVRGCGTNNCAAAYYVRQCRPCELRALPVLLQKPSLWTNFHKAFTALLRDIRRDRCGEAPPLQNIHSVASVTNRGETGNVTTTPSLVASLPDLYHLILRFDRDDPIAGLKVFREVLYSVLTGIQVLVYSNDTELSASIVEVLSRLLPPPLRRVVQHSDKLIQPYQSNLVSFSNTFITHHDIVYQRSASAGCVSNKKLILLRNLPECVVLRLTVARRCDADPNATNHASPARRLLSLDLMTNYEDHPSVAVQRSPARDSGLSSSSSHHNNTCAGDPPMVDEDTAVVSEYRKKLKCNDECSKRTTYGDLVEMICEREWRNAEVTSALIDVLQSEWARKSRLFCVMLREAHGDGQASDASNGPTDTTSPHNGSFASDSAGSTRSSPSYMQQQALQNKPHRTGNPLRWFKDVMFKLGPSSSSANSLNPRHSHGYGPPHLSGFTRTPSYSRSSLLPGRLSLAQRHMSAADVLMCDETDIPVLRYLGSWKHASS